VDTGDILLNRVDRNIGLSYDTYQRLWNPQFVQPVVVTRTARYLSVRQFLGG